MGHNLMSMADFGLMLKMQYTYVVRACKTVLKPAMVEGKIDIDHACVQLYIKRRKTAPSIIHTDASKPMSERAVDVCQKSGLWSVKCIRKNLPIGDKKAAGFLDLMTSQGLVPKGYDKNEARSIKTKTKKDTKKRNQ